MSRCGLVVKYHTRAHVIQNRGQVTNNNGWVVSRADNARVEGAANRGSKPVQVAFNTTIQAVSPLRLP